MKITSKTFCIFLMFLSLMTPNISLAQEKTIAITIDDLPFVGEYRNLHLKKIMHSLQEQEIPATGFIIAGEMRPDNWEVLQQFREAGFGLGNHTFSHANLNKLTVKEYIHEIHKADDLLSHLLTKPKYFRYPYLAMSSGTKKDEILCYLADNDYQVAPITIDSKDFIFNQRLLSVPEMDRRSYLDELKISYLDFLGEQTIKAEAQNKHQAQILLIHANLLNAYVLPDIIQYYKENDYTFVSLEEALKTFKHPIHCAKSQTPSELALNSAKPERELQVDDFVAWD